MLKMQYIEKFSSLYTTVKSSIPMTMAVDGYPNNLDTNGHANKIAGHTANKTYPSTRWRRKKPKAPNISQIIEETHLTRKKRQKNWTSKDSNTETMMAGGERTTAKNKGQQKLTDSNKKSKGTITQGKQVVITKEIIDNAMITTEPNGKRFDIRGRMKILGASDQQLELSTKAYTTAYGLGSLYDDLQQNVKEAAKVMRWKHQQPTPKAAQELSKKGLTPEEWLILCTAMATTEVFDQMMVDKYLTHKEIISLMILMNRAAHTKPSIVCARITNSKSKATLASSFWYGAKQALGSWYTNEKNTKSRTPTIEESLKLAAKNKEMNKTTMVTPVQASKKRKGSQAQDTKARKKTSQESGSDMSDDSENESLSDDDDDMELSAILKPTSKTAMDIDSDEDTDNDTEMASTTTKDADKTADSTKTHSPDREKETDQDEETMVDPQETIDMTSDAESTVIPQDEPKKAKGKKQVTINGVSTSATPKRSKGETADVQASRRLRQVRLQLMLKLKASTKRTPAETCVRHLHTLYETLRKVDGRTMIMPWNEADSAKHGGITKVHDLPTKFGDWKLFLDRCRPQKDKDCWMKIRFAGSMEPEQYTSLNGSGISFWYDEHEHRGYLCPIQNSDRPKAVGLFLYSGAFIDHIRLTECIRQEMLLKRRNVDWKIGVRVKKCMDLTANETPHPNGFLMQDTHMAHVMADASQAKDIAMVLYRRFNDKTKNPGNPGGYDFRFLPEKEFTTTGSNGLKNRQDMLKKHRCVQASSRVLTSIEIKHLDLETDISHLDMDTQIMTLRCEMQAWTYPLVPEAGQTATQKLIRTVDFAASGPDAGAKVYVTVYEDRAELAERLLAILPAFITWKYDESITKKWCVHSMETTEVEFHTDDAGNWNGTWTTEDDRLHALMLEEDVGYRLEFDNMQMLAQDERRGRRMLHVEEASLATFNMDANTENGRQTQPSDISTVYASDADTVAAASVASGDSGTTS